MNRVIMKLSLGDRLGPRRYVENSDFDDNDGWETSHEKPSRQKEDDNNDGWETISKKSSRRHRKVPKDQWRNYKCPSNEQNYVEEVSYILDMQLSQELANLPKAAYKLWELDLNRLAP